MSKRASRTKRRENPQPIQVTERDEAVLIHLLRFGLLTKEQLHKLVGGGKDGFRKRLRRLFDSDLVDKPHIQNEMFRYTEKRPSVYLLGNNGARYLRGELGRDVPQRDYRRQAKERHGFRGQTILKHDVGANGCVIDLEHSLKQIEGVRVHTPEDILTEAPEWTRKAKKPFAIPTTYTWVGGRKHKRVIEPDGIVGYTETRREKPVQILLFVEFDQKMAIKRNDPQQSSIRQKIASYTAMFHEQTVKARYGFDAFRVLFVTTGSSGHVDLMVEECAEYRKDVVRGTPPYPFYFTTHEAFEACDNPLEAIWRDGDGKKKEIM